MTSSHIVGLILLALISYGILLVSCERRIIYHPFKYPEGNWNTSSSAVFKEDIYFKADDAIVASCAGG